MLICTMFHFIMAIVVLFVILPLWNIQFTTSTYLNHNNSMNPNNYKSRWTHIRRRYKYDISSKIIQTSRKNDKNIVSVHEHAKKSNLDHRRRHTNNTNHMIRRHFFIASNVMTSIILGNIGGYSLLHNHNANAATPTTPTSTTTTMIPYSSSSSSSSTVYISSSNNNDHRQLELCIISIVRVNFWLQQQIQYIQNELKVKQQQQIQQTSISNDDTDQNTNDHNYIQDTTTTLMNHYLEIRYGAKAVLTGRIPSGKSTRPIYTLATLQLSSCLQDIQWYATSYNNRRSSTTSSYRSIDNNNNDSMNIINLKNMDVICQTYREGLASLVEFDGLDTLRDPSPRSTLIMTQYNDQKIQYILRTIQEIIIPTGQQIVLAFGLDPYQRSIQYIEQYYPDEIPKTYQSPI